MKIYLLLFLLLLPICYSETASTGDLRIEFTLNPVHSEDNAISVINPLSRNDTKGYLYVKEIFPEVPPVITTSGGAWYFQKTTLYYDVIVNVLEDHHSRGDKVAAKIIIINKGHVPDNDAVLTYALLSPSGENFGETKEVFEQVPPLCENGYWDNPKQMCFVNGEYVTPNIYALIRDISLPKDAELGQWQFVVYYESGVQPLIGVYDTFYVNKGYTVWIIMLALVLLYFYWKYTKNKRKINQQKKIIEEERRRREEIQRQQKTI